MAPRVRLLRGERPAVTVAGCAVLLLILSVARGVSGGGADAFVFPVVLAVALAVAALSLLKRRSYAPVAALALLFLTMLLYGVVLAGGAQWWLRVWSILGLLASGYAGWTVSRAHDCVQSLSKGPS